MSSARWKSIIDGFAAAGVDEGDLYNDHHDAILGLFHDEKTKLFPSIDGPTKFSENTAKLILGKLVHFHGRDKILKQLKSFNFGFKFFLVNEDGDCLPHHRTRAMYEIFKDAGLIDNTWHGLSNLLITCDSGEEGISDILSILEEGLYTNFYPTSLCCPLLNKMPTAKRVEYFRNPLLGNLILEAFRNHDYIESSIYLSPYEKKELYQELYSLAHQKGVLKEIKTIPAELNEWFASRPDSK